MLLSLLLLACGGDQPRIASLAPAEDLLFQDVALFTGHGSERLEHQDLLVKDGQIAEIGPTGGPTAAGARVVEGAGRTLLPGLVDAHTHLTAPLGPPWKYIGADPAWVLETQLRAGVTTIFDMGGDPEVISDVLGRVASGALPAPRVYWTASSITAPGAHPIATIEALVPGPLARLVTRKILVAGGPEDAAARVAAVVDSGADYVKIIYDSLPEGTPHMDRPTLEALIRAAHERDQRVFVHVGTIDDALEAAEAGADALAHAPSRGGISPEQAERLAAAHIPVVATLSGYLATAALSEGRWAPSEIDRALIPASILAPVTGAEGARFSDEPLLAEVARGVNPQMGALVATLAGAGVTILAGTDSPLPGAYPGAGLHDELVALVEQAGFTPAAALRAATRDAALALAPDARFGVLEAGYDADLLLVEGDPCADIRALDRVVMVVRAGRALVAQEN